MPKQLQSWDLEQSILPIPLADWLQPDICLLVTVFGARVVDIFGEESDRTAGTGWMFINAFSVLDSRSNMAGD